MSVKLIVRAQAYWDMDEIAAHIQKDSAQTALRFLESAEATLCTLAEMPGLGTRYSVRNRRLAGLRCFPVSGFRNYLVFYQPMADAIEVIRILHGARNVPAILRREE